MRAEPPGRGSLAFHVVFSRPVDRAAIAAGAAAGTNPANTNLLLADTLGAIVHDGAGLAPTVMDRLLGRVLGQPPLAWTIARALRRQVAQGDVLFCTGEDIGLPVAALCGARARVAVMAHNVTRRRVRLALTLLRAERRVARFFAVAQPQAAFLRRRLRLPPGRATFLWDQTDLAFFRPGAAAPHPRPIIMSVGLEQRDYRTLAAATADLPADVRISGFSADAVAISRAFPPVLPANMERRAYSWPDLLRLYQTADVVAVTLAPNTYAAGVQVLMEAMACGRPTVVSGTEGLADYLDRADAVTTVPPGDPPALRAAIAALLADPARARAQGQAALVLANERHATAAYLERLVEALRELAAT